MSRKHFSWLLLVTFLVGAAVLLLPQQTAKDSVPGSGLLLPDLADSVNDIDWLQLTVAGSEVVATLQRQGDVWVVQESSNYRADWELIRKLLSGLAQARIVEPKTSNPDYYERLGVEDVALDTAGGIMIAFSPDTGLPAVIMGNNAQARNGQYVRLAGSGASALIDTVLDAPSDLSGWLDTSIVDIPGAEVVEVEISHPDSETVKITKSSADDENFSLQNIPEGREIKSEWSVNSLGNVLQDLELDAVVPRESLEWNGAVRLYLLTADGLVIEASVIEKAGEGDDSEFWIQLEAQLYTTAVETAPEEVSGDGETRARAEAINDRVRGWAYRIPQYKYNGMMQRMEDLLQAVDEPS
jgi:hypothetical protein